MQNLESNRIEEALLAFKKAPLYSKGEELGASESQMYLVIHIGYESNKNIKWLSICYIQLQNFYSSSPQTHGFSSLLYQSHCHYARNVMASLKPPGQQCSYCQ